MVPFLKQVAQYYYESGKAGGRCFIFPNRRSMVFFKKYLTEAVVVASDKPLRMPRLLTVNEFFSKVAPVSVADRGTLLVILYDCYVKLNPKAESLDDFIFWGDIILGDFNDVPLSFTYNTIKKNITIVKKITIEDISLLLLFSSCPKQLLRSFLQF